MESNYGHYYFLPQLIAETNSAGNLSQCVQFDMVSSLTLLLLLLYCYCCLTYGSSGWLFPPEWSNGYESYNNNRILKETSE